MIRQPDRESRNVNDLFYEFEKRRIDKSNEVIGDVELTSSEEKVMIWMCGLDEYTIDNLLSVIKKVAQKRASENASDENGNNGKQEEHN